MLGISFGEIAVILTIALVVVGPKKLPELIHSVGKIVGKLRYFTDKVRKDLEEEFKVDELKKSFEAINPASELASIRKELTTVSKTTEDAMRLAQDRFKHALADPVVNNLDGEPLSLEEHTELVDEFDHHFDDFGDYYAEPAADLLVKAPRNYSATVHSSPTFANKALWQRQWQTRQLDLSLEEGTRAFHTHQLKIKQQQRVLRSEEALEAYYLERTQQLNAIAHD